MLSHDQLFTPKGLQSARLLCPWRFSRQEYWNGLPCPSPGNLPNPWVKSRSPALQVDSLQSEPPGTPKTTGVRPPRKPLFTFILMCTFLVLKVLYRYQHHLVTWSFAGMPSMMTVKYLVPVLEWAVSVCPVFYGNHAI